MLVLIPVCIVIGLIVFNVVAWLMTKYLYEQSMYHTRGGPELEERLSNWNGKD